MNVGVLVTAAGLGVRLGPGTPEAHGAQRSDSVPAALEALPPEADLSLVQDAARCPTPPAFFAQVIDALRAGAHAAIPVFPVQDTVQRVDGDRVVETVPRAHRRAVQTPQGSRPDVLRRAHVGPGDRHTDDAGMVEAPGAEVVPVPGSEAAFAVTRPVDLLLPEAVLSAR